MFAQVSDRNDFSGPNPVTMEDVTGIVFDAPSSDSLNRLDIDTTHSFYLWCVGSHISSCFRTWKCGSITSLSLSKKLLIVMRRLMSNDGTKVAVECQFASLSVDLSTFVRQF